MRLTKDAIELIKKSPIRLKLAIELGCSDRSIIRYIDDNDFNGPLTTAGALKVIREETGLNDDQILEAKVEKAELQK